MPAKSPIRGIPRGVSLIYLVVAMAAFIAMASLGIDIAHARLVKGQLQCGADAAARHGATGLLAGPSTAINNAVSAAAANKADGSTISLNTNNDVQLGTWNSSTKTFTVLSGAATSTANAIRVYARRTAASNNPVSLSFSSLMGKSTADVAASAIGHVNPGGYGVIGLNSINLGGNSTDSYWSPNGYTTGGSFGSIASNGDITLGGSANIQGSAHPGVGHSVSNTSGVSGSTAPLTQPLSYPNASPSSYAFGNNNNQVPSTYMSGLSFNLGSNKSVALPGGTYFFNNFSMGSGASLTFTGPATVYVFGSFNMTGGSSTYSNVPGNLKIIMGPDLDGDTPGNMTIGGSSALYASIYAPQSNINLSGTGDIYGSIVGLTVSSTGTSSIHYDASLNGPGYVSLVQ